MSEQIKGFYGGLRSEIAHLFLYAHAECRVGFSKGMCCREQDTQAAIDGKAALIDFIPNPPGRYLLQFQNRNAHLPELLQLLNSPGFLGREIPHDPQCTLPLCVAASQGNQEYAQKCKTKPSFHCWCMIEYG